MEEVRITATVGKVLRVFLDDVTAPRYGFELMQRTGLASGTLYRSLPGWRPPAGSPSPRKCQPIRRGAPSAPVLPNY